MAFIKVHQKPTGLARVLVVAAITAPCCSFAQALFDFAANDAQRQIVERIQAIELQDGSSSANLIEPLTALGLSLQEEGRYVLSTLAIQRALEVVRFNHGLYALEQAPLIRQVIANEEAVGNVTAAWNMQLELLALARRHPDDLRTVPVLRELANDRMEFLARYEAGAFPPQIILGCYYAWSNSSVVPVRDADVRPRQSTSCYSGSRRDVVRGILLEARRYYEEALAPLISNEHFTSDELRDLEMEYLYSNYRLRDWASGRQSLRRLLSYDVARSESALNRLISLVRIADWDLLFDHRKLALDAYEQAYRLLASDQPEAVPEIFAPNVPLVIPEFLPSPLVSDETADSNGYVDVAFAVTKYGMSENIEVLGASMNVSDADKNRLVQRIAVSRFRPRLATGQLADAAQVIVRYYLTL